jgi:hypothetical protein
MIALILCANLIILDYCARSHTGSRVFPHSGLGFTPDDPALTRRPTWQPT